MFWSFAQAFADDCIAGLPCETAFTGAQADFVALGGVDQPAGQLNDAGLVANGDGHLNTRSGFRDEGRCVARGAGDVSHVGDVIERQERIERHNADQEHPAAPKANGAKPHVVQFAV